MRRRGEQLKGRKSEDAVKTKKNRKRSSKEGKESLVSPHHFFKSLRAVT
jgi:hypothetical protein